MVLFAVFTWTEHAHVGASQISLDTRGRLADLIAVLSRVNQKYIAQEKRSLESFYNAGDDFLQKGIDKTKEQPLWKSGGFRRKMRSFIRRRRQRAIDNFYHEYEQFYGLMTTFLNDLVTKLKPDAPDDLQHLTIIPDILPLDDPDNNKTRILQKGKDVLSFMVLVLQSIGQYVIDSEENWLTQQTRTLVNHIRRMIEARTNLKNSPDDPKDSSAGLGGFNSNYQSPLSYRPVNKDDLQALNNTLSINSR
ncbi:hypothetical protein PoB_007681800 [Plakobranchus ocellatus]|uniref:Uncharacterized protein n=1 Tax=Plakobranchus ocellatus TaxID=259542 RepID=A0AAV4E169_9GAST|nr:hypothetical protein PoB_007681800 [Plakobranchus ocellatus]